MYNSYDSFTKIYLIVYSLITFFMIFMLDSQMVFIIGPIKSINMIITLLAIIINFYLILLKNDFKIESGDVMLSISIIILSILPHFFEVQIISPFFVMLYLMIINAKYINPHLFIRTDFKIRTFSIILVFVFYSLHLFNDVLVVRDYSLRHSMGFNNPNLAGIVILSLLLSFMLLFNNLNNKFINNFYIIIMIILFIYVINMTDSRGLQIPGTLVILLFIFRKMKIFQYIYSKLTFPMFIFTLLISIITVFILNPNSQLFYLLNQLTTYRISNASAVFKIYPVNLFGYIDVSSLKNVDLGNYLTPGTDNNYLSILRDFGIVGLSILIIVFIKGIHIIKKHKNYLLSICFIAVFLAFVVAQCRELYAPLIYAFSLTNIYKKDD